MNRAYVKFLVDVSSASLYRKAIYVADATRCFPLAFYRSISFRRITSSRLLMIESDRVSEAR
jgi:hypothetical protein